MAAPLPLLLKESLNVTRVIEIVSDRQRVRSQTERLGAGDRL